LGSALYGAFLMQKKQIKFKDAFERLEQIVSSLESREVDVEDAVKKYAEGLALVNICKAKLEEAENKIKEVKEVTG